MAPPKMYFDELLERAVRLVMDAREDPTGAVMPLLVSVVTAGESMTKWRTRSINALNVLVRSNKLGMVARRKVTAVQIEQVFRWREREKELASGIARSEAVRLAQHIFGLSEQLKSSEQKLDDLVKVSEAAALPEGKASKRWPQ